MRRPLQVVPEVEEISRNLDTLRPYLKDAKVVQSGLAVAFFHMGEYFTEYASMTSPNWSFHDYRNNLNRHLVGRLHRMHLRPDVISPVADLTPYRLLITQQQYTLEEGDFLERIMPWVEAGGTWVVGPMTDIFTPHGAKYKHAPFGHLEDWANITRLFYAPAHSTSSWGAEDHAPVKLTDVRLSDGFVAHTDPLHYDVYEPGEGVSVLGTYAEGGDDYLPGHAAITETRIGEGRIVMMGCQLDEEGFRHFIGTLCAECGIDPIAEGSDSIQNSLLAGPNGELFTAIESKGWDEGGYTVLPFDATDLLSGREFSAGERVEMGAYDCIFAKKKEN